MPYRYPVYRPSLQGREKEYVLECLDSTWISSKGKFVGVFETQMADYVGVEHAVGVCNGTIALHLALVTLGIGPGDEVIVPTFTYISAVNVIQYTGATPVFVDSLPDTWQMDPEDVRRKVTAKTKAIMVVHLYGNACDMKTLCDIAKTHDLFVVEDCAEAFGAQYQGRPIGSFGHIAGFSFFGNKTITTGEGGMVVTDDKTLYERAFHIKGQGLAKYREYWHDVVGYNYRLTNICAAIGVAQMERSAEIIAKKRDIARWYQQMLTEQPLTFQKEEKGTVSSHWMVTVLTEKAEQRDLLREHLEDAGIETRPAFYPVHTMPMYSSRYQRHPVAENISWRGINLPSYPDLSQDDVQTIADVIGGFFKQATGVS